MCAQQHIERVYVCIRLACVSDRYDGSRELPQTIDCVHLPNSTSVRWNTLSKVVSFSSDLCENWLVFANKRAQNELGDFFLKTSWFRVCPSAITSGIRLVAANIFHQFVFFYRFSQSHVLFHRSIYSICLCRFKSCNFYVFSIVLCRRQCFLVTFFFRFHP